MIYLEGQAVSDARMAQLRMKIDELTSKDIRVQMAIVLIGDDHASNLYATFMQRRAEAVGFCATIYRLPSQVSQRELEALLQRLSDDPNVHGILPMMPLPSHCKEDEVLAHISPKKDLDGLTIWSIGLMNSGKEGFAPCTPMACVAILDYYGIEIEGKHVAVVGRSKVVGRPMANLMLQRHGTVTICHSRTPDLAKILKEADIVISAVGKPHCLKGYMFKKGVTIIDVGINELEGKTVGDVEEATVKDIAQALTPVPGGVGAVTTVMMLEALYKAYMGLQEHA